MGLAVDVFGVSGMCNGDDVYGYGYTKEDRSRRVAKKRLM
jgi:hypothetical protein